jgi:hypothetical protein
MDRVAGHWLESPAETTTTPTQSPARALDHAPNVHLDGRDVLGRRHGVYGFAQLYAELAEVAREAAEARQADRCSSDQGHRVHEGESPVRGRLHEEGSG